MVVGVRWAKSRPNSASAKNVSGSIRPCLKSSVQMTVVSENTLPKREPQLPKVPTKQGPVHAAGTAPKGNRPNTNTHMAQPVVEPMQEPTKGLAALRICLNSGSLEVGAGEGVVDTSAAADTEVSCLLLSNLIISHFAPLGVSCWTYLKGCARVGLLSW
jgi:hypothetical protein